MEDQQAKEELVRGLLAAVLCVFDMGKVMQKRSEMCMASQAVKRTVACYAAVTTDLAV